MKAIRLTAPGLVERNPLTADDVPVPEPGERELLIRIHACGVCHTDLHIVEGDLQPRRSPLIPGHQIVGIVERVGKSADKHKVGTRVGVPWLYRTCGKCEFCKRGEENLCDEGMFTGYDVDGGFAEYIVAPADFAYRIPEQFSNEDAAPLLCAGIIGFRALRLSDVKPGGRLGLYGFGASAHITIQVARHWGCEVYVFSRSNHHRKHAEELGAVWTGPSDAIAPKPLDSVISFAPVGELVPNALRALRKGGTLALAAVTMTPIPSFAYPLVYHERTIRSVANSTRQDAIDFLALAAQIPVRTETEVLPLEEANRALQLLKEGKIRGAAVLRVSH